MRFAAVLYSCIVAPLWLRSARSTYTHGVGLLEWLIDVLFVVNTLLHLVFPYYDTDAQQLVIDMAAIRDHALSTFELRINALASTPARGSGETGARGGHPPRIRTQRVLSLQHRGSTLPMSRLIARSNAVLISDV